jgi:HEPN domain-containing protein
MTNKTLAGSYRIKAEKRLKILPVLLQEEAYSDVIREAQEIVELALKGMLRQIGIDPPNFHDVGDALLEFSERLPEEIRIDVQKLADISKWLRKEREFSYHGDIDFILTEEYDRGDAIRAMTDAAFVCEAAIKVIPL